jgi:glycosyltransferase involved in cell wall biosynthesis
MLKVCMVVHKNYYHDVRVRRYAESLAGMHAQVDVICPRLDEIEPFDAGEHVQVFLIPMQHLDHGMLRYVFEYLLSLFLYFIRLTLLHWKNRYDVIHIHNMPDFLVFAALIPKLMGVPLILDVHDPMPEVFISKYGTRANRLLLCLVRWQEQLSCKLVDEVITVNAVCEENLKKRGVSAEKITVIHNYPNAAIFDRRNYPAEQQKMHDTFTLIFPGTLAPRYGLDTVIRALPQIRSKVSNVRLLVFCPNTPYKDSLLQLAEQLGVLPFVEILPLIRNEDVPRQLMQADVGIYPAHADVHMNLATPTKVLEYAAMGLPIISSRMDMVEEIFGDSAILFFEAGNAAQFADCVLKLHQEPNLRREFSNNAYQIFQQKLSWGCEFEIYRKMLTRLLQDQSLSDPLPTVKSSR